MADAAGAAAMHVPSILFSCSVTFLVLVFAVVLRLERRKRASKPGDGLLVLDGWGPLRRGLVALVILVSALIPVVLFVSAAVFGAILAYLEGWDFSYGFSYTVANMIDMPGSLAPIPSTGTAARAVDVVISVWVMLFTNLVLGVATSLNIIAYVVRKLPESYFSLLRCLLLYTPLALLVLSLLSGAFLAWLEHWRAVDGIMLMVGTLCGLAKPLTDVAPKTRQGYFFLALCFAVELALGGCVVGLVGAHPKMSRLLQLLEGKCSSDLVDEADYIRSVELLASGGLCRLGCSPREEEQVAPPKKEQGSPGFERLRAEQLEAELQQERQALHYRLEEVARKPQLTKVQADMREKELQLENERLREEMLRLSVMTRPSVQAGCRDASLGCGRTAKSS